MPRITAKASTLLLPLTIAACAPDGGTGDGAGEGAAGETGATAAPTAAAGVREELLVSPASLADRLEEPGLVLVHVGRDSADYAAGHIPGARFLPLSAIAVERDGLPNQLPPVERLDSVFEALGVGGNDRVVLYGPPLAAARAFVALDVLGHPRTALLDGGLAAWRAEQRPVSAERPGHEPARLELEPRPDRLVDGEWVAAHREAPGIVLLDARPRDAYTGEAAGTGVRRPGHIPGARHLFWERTVESAERPVLKDAETLRALLAEAGVAEGATVVTYCRTGMQSSFLYFVVRYLGHEARLYDGSYMDWDRRGLPVERGGGAP